MRKLFCQCGGFLWFVLLAISAQGQQTNIFSYISSSEDLVQHGQMEIKSNLWEAAGNDFRAAIAADPKNSLAYAYLGNTLQYLDHFEEAAGMYKQAVSINPRFARAYYGLGNSYYHLKDYPAAVDSLRRCIALDPTNFGAYETMGFSLYKLNQFEAAAGSLQMAVQLQPDDYDANFWRGKSLLKTTNAVRFQEAAESFHRCVLLGSTNAYCHVELGFCQDKIQHYNEAVQTLQQAVSLDPQDADAELWLGISYSDRGDHEKAVDSLKRCVSLDPAKFSGYNWLGFNLYKLNQFSAGAEAYQKAIQLKPDDFDANFWRGNCLLAAGRFEAATASFEKASQVRKEGDDNVRWPLFLCYLITSQYGEAYNLFPTPCFIGGGLLFLFYLIGLMVLLKLSFKIQPRPFPGFGFGVAWIIVLFEGQIALVLPLGLLNGMGMGLNPLTSLVLAGIPLIIAAGKGFSRQPWGGPFAWPLRLGTGKIISISLLLLLLAFLCEAGYSALFEQLTKKPMLQDTVPLITYAMNANPLTAFLAVVIIGPITEEILFRGLIYGALQSRFRAGAVIGLSSFLFALVHLQGAAFIPIFCVGLVLGWCRWKSGSIGLPILIHCLNNGWALIMTKFFGNNF